MMLCTPKHRGLLLRQGHVVVLSESRMTGISPFH